MKIWGQHAPKRRHSRFKGQGTGTNLGPEIHEEHQEGQCGDSKTRGDRGQIA